MLGADVNDKENACMIYDCFPFFNELDLLEIRLNILDPIVDKFVLVESTQTFNRQPKPLYYQENKERFAKFADKIIHIVCDEDLSHEDNPWVIEYVQKNYMEKGWTACQDDDIILISDLDEIPNPEKVLEYKDKPGIKCFQNNFYYYYLNYFCVDEPIWYKGTRMCKFKDTRHGLDNVKVGMNSRLPAIYKQGTTPNKIRYYKNGPWVKNGGWHFSYLGGAETIRKKILSISHTEFHKDEYTDIEKIKERVMAGEDLFGRGKHFRSVPIDDSFPKYIRDNIDKYQNLIIESEHLKPSFGDKVKIFIKKYISK